MFWIVCDPSSGSTELCLTEICSGSQMFVVYLFVVCVHGSSQPVVPYTHTEGSNLQCQTPTKHTKNICEPPRVILVKHSSVLPDDGLHMIRNMLE